jgi:hypothetical protein
MATKLTLELPAAAAKTLAAMSPEQIAELSRALGYSVQSVTVHPNESTRRHRANSELCDLPVYHDAVPWAAIDEILSRHDFNPVPQSAADCGNRVHVQVGNNTWLLVTVYRMESGRLEVISYLS